MIFSYSSLVYGLSLLAPMAKSLPAMWETQARSLGGEDQLEEGMATHSSLLVWRPQGQRSLAGFATPRTLEELNMTE